MLNVQNGHFLQPLTCVLSILDLRILRVNFRLFHFLHKGLRHTLRVFLEGILLFTPLLERAFVL